MTKLTDFGAFARVEDTVEGLIHVSELTEAHIRHPKEVVDVGDTMTLRVVSLDPERHRLGLSLKQAEEEAPTEYRDPHFEPEPEEEESDEAGVEFLESGDEPTEAEGEPEESESNPEAKESTDP